MTRHNALFGARTVRACAFGLTAAMVCATAAPLLAADPPTSTSLLESGIAAARALPDTNAASSPDDATQDQPALHAGATEYSDAYQTRRKIHKIASFATLPMLGTELWLGQSMYNATPTDASSKRGLHAAIGSGIIGLFAVNTVTGAWNLFGEGRHDPNGRTLRLVHGILMMVADAGFVAAAQSGPNSRSARQALTFETSKATHRNIAVASISVATTSYLLMLFGNH